MLRKKPTIIILIFSWILLSSSALCQDAPAAERIFEDTPVIQKNEMGQRGTKDVKEISVPVKEKVQEKRSLKRKKRLNSGNFWRDFLAIFGILLMLLGLASFFLFGIVGWWVVLISLGFIIMGVLAMAWSASIEGSAGGLIIGIGAVILGMFALIGWGIGVIGVGIYDLVT